MMVGGRGVIERAGFGCLVVDHYIFGVLKGMDDIDA